MQSPNARPSWEAEGDRDERRTARTVFWVTCGVGLAAIGAALVGTALLRASAGRQDDPTTARIQELIDEANSLLKALDDQRHSA